jgi:hypothetical protein
VSVEAAKWPFDQPPDTAAVSDRRVVEAGAPVLLVIHYSGDDGWAFLSGGAWNVRDGRLIAMSEALNRDASLRSIADLPVGWTATRPQLGAEWIRQPDPDV